MCDGLITLRQISILAVVVRVRRKTDLKNDSGSKFPSSRPVNLRRFNFHPLLRIVQNCPDANLPIPPAYQEAVLGCAADVGLLWETSQSAMVLPPKLLDWYDYGDCVESYNAVRLGPTYRRKGVALPPDTRTLNPFVSNVAMALTSF